MEPLATDVVFERNRGRLRGRASTSPAEVNRTVDAGRGTKRSSSWTWNPLWTPVLIGNRMEKAHVLGKIGHSGSKGRYLRTYGAIHGIAWAAMAQLGPREHFEHIEARWTCSKA